MLKRINWIEVIAIVPALIFMVARSAYHISYDGYLGLSREVWINVWRISEQGFDLSLVVTVLIYSYGMTRKYFWLLVPYILFTAFYWFSCYAGLYFWTAKTWEDIWSWVMSLYIFMAFIIFLLSIKKNHVA